MPIPSSFLTDRITATQAQIVAYEDAILALGTSGATHHYTLDTGQSTQTVTRDDIDKLNETLNSMYNRLATLCARQDNQDGRASDSVIRVQPAW